MGRLTIALRLGLTAIFVAFTRAPRQNILRILLFICLVQLNNHVTSALKDPPTFVRGSSNRNSETAAWSSASSELSKDDDDEDDNSDEDDDGDDDGKRTNVVVASVPVVLGIVTIVLLCVFMLCRRNYQRNHLKWTGRLNQQRTSLTSTRQLDLFDPEIGDRHPASYESSGYHSFDHPNSTTENANRPTNTIVVSPVVPPSAPPAQQETTTAIDPPPSYEEVMREHTNNRLHTTTMPDHRSPESS